MPLRSFSRAEEKRGQHQAWHRAGSAREHSAARGGARGGMSGARWGAGAAGEAPASGRGTGTAAHLWEEPPSRRGDPSRQPGAGKRGLARPPPSWEGEQPRRGLPREIKNRERMAPQSRSWAFTRKNRDQDRLLPEFPAAAAQCPTCEHHPRMKTTRRGVPVDLAFAAVYLLLPTRHELGVSRLKKQRLVSPRKTRLVLHCRTICVYTPGLLSPQSHENAIVTSL